MNKRLLIAPVVLAVVFGSGYWLDRSKSARQSSLSGFFESQPTMAASRLGGRVEAIYAEEGQAVSGGSRLVKLSNDSFSADVQAVQNRAEQAQQGYLEALRGSRPEDLAKAQGVLAEAESNYERIKNGPRPEEIDAARHKLDASKELLAKLRNGARSEEIAAAQAAADAARANLALAKNGPTEEELSQLRARVASASANLDLQSKELTRVGRLVKEGALAGERLDSAQAAYLQAEAAQKDAQAALTRANKGSRTEELQRAEASYRQALAQARQLEHGSRKEDISAAEQQVLVDEANLRLLQKGSRPEDVSAALARVNQASAELAKARNGARPEVVNQARAAARAAQAELRSAKRQLGEQAVYAPKAGIVDRVLVAIGDVVPAGTPVVRLSDPNDIWIRVYLPEKDLAKVKIGDEAILRVDGIGEDVPGVVESIATRGEFTPANLQSPEERGNQVFEIRLRLAKPNPNVKAGMYAAVKRMGRWQ